MKIIEFAGLPGCGKSTLCKCFIENFSKKNVYTYGDIIRFVSTKKRRIVYGSFVLFNPFRWNFLKLLKNLTNEYDNVSIQAIFILIALYDITGFLKIFKRNSVVILDEGFIQNITSIAHLNLMDDDKALNDLVSYIKSKRDILSVNCFANEETVISRIRNRNGRDRFNLIKDDEDLKKAFVIKQNNISLVSKHFKKGMNICMDGTSEEAMEQLIQQYKQYC